MMPQSHSLLFSRLSSFTPVPFPAALPSCPAPLCPFLLPGALPSPAEPYLGEGGREGHLVQVELGHALEGDGEHDAQAAKVQAGGLEDVRIDGLGALQDVPRGRQQRESYDLPEGEERHQQALELVSRHQPQISHPPQISWLGAAPG